MARAPDDWDLRPRGRRRLIGRPPVALIVSRSFGDREFKAAGGAAGDLVTATPDVQELELSERHRYVVLMSDGLSDVMTDDEAGGVARAAETALRRASNNFSADI